MVFVPREPFRAGLPGLAPPRAVPSDLVIAAASRVLAADIVQKIVLLAIFVLACAGVAALLEHEPLLPRLAGGVFFAWNPYVGERLIVGQWALLLGYAGLPWVLRAVLRPDLGTWRGAARLALAMIPAIIGGFAAMAITALIVIPAALFTRDVRRAAVAITVLAVGCLPWFIPAVMHTVYTSSAGIAAFAARADTPFGSVGSLVMLGGAWNADTVPRGYGGGWSAVWLAVVLAGLAGYVLLVRPKRCLPGLGIAGIAGLVIACAGVTGVGRAVLRDVVGGFPGAALFRDGQQFVAPLALVEACGLGQAAAWGAYQCRYEKMRNALTGGENPAATLIGVFALIAPLALLPGLAWGAGGRLRPAWYPATWLAAARVIDASRASGAALLLPWASYRTPAWNHGEALLDPWPRLLARQVIWNDGTQVGDVVLAPDDPRARRLDALISGTGPLTGALRAAGVRFVIDDPDEQGPGELGPGEPAGTRLPGAVKIIDQPGLTVYRLPG